jgi:hypothetical protein
MSKRLGAFFLAELWLKATGNHTAYKQVKGTKTSAEEILTLYEGLRQSNLTNFDVLLTGYMPSAEAVQAIGKIGRDVKFNAGTKPGSFFWGRCGDTLHVVGRANTGQCSIQLWATMASSTSRKTKFLSTRGCSARQTLSFPTNLRRSESHSACTRQNLLT